MIYITPKFKVQPVLYQKRSNCQFCNNKDEIQGAIKKVCGIWNNNEIKCLIQKAVKCCNLSMK